MSLDAQYPFPVPLTEISAIVRGRLSALGFRFDGNLLGCAECGVLSVLHLQHDLVDGDWLVSCERCGHRNSRTYADPIRALLLWNANQFERADSTQHLTRGNGHEC